MDQDALHTILSVEGIGDLWSNPYVYLGVTNCNADDFARFSKEVWLKLNIKSEYRQWRYIGHSLCEIFKGTYAVLVKANGNFESIKNSKQRKAAECLAKFMNNLENDGNHLKCLEKLETIEKTKSDGEKKKIEAQIQSVLACHLFSPLLTEGEVIVDRICYKTNENSSHLDPECPFCKQALKTGNTNFGCKDLWHGRADIIIKSKDAQQIVRVTVEDDDDDEEEEEQGQGEPSAKKARLDEDSGDAWCSFAEVKTVLDDSVSTLASYKSQAISQTIMNSFLAVKQNNKLENRLIPSFFVSSQCIFINFYNVKKDILLVQSLPMKLFNADGINYWAVLSVWMALNFERFPCRFDDDSYNKLSSKSGFIDWLERCNIFEKYKNEIECEFTSVRKPITKTSEICVNPLITVKLVEELRHEIDSEKK